jgi:hypothetical protein
VLGESRNHPGRRRIKIAWDSCVAGLVLAHGFDRPDAARYLC